MDQDSQPMSKTTALASREGSLAQTIAFARGIVADALWAANLIKFNAADMPHVYALSLYGTLFHLTHNCITLAESEDATGIPILLRTMHEAAIDLDNLLADPEYHENMEAANLKQIIKLLEHPLFGSILPTDERNAYRTRFDELTKKGRGNLRINKRYERAGRESEHDSMYALYCLDSHNNIAALAERHVTSDGDCLQVNIFEPKDEAETSRRLDMVLHCFLDSAQRIHQAFRIGEEAVRELVARYNEYRTALSASSGSPT